MQFRNCAGDHRLLVFGGQTEAEWYTKIEAKGRQQQHQSDLNILRFAVLARLVCCICTTLLATPADLQALEKAVDASIPEVSAYVYFHCTILTLV